MAEHIPFITGKDVKYVAAAAFGDSDFVRVAAHQSESLWPSNGWLWIDPAVDGLDDWQTKLNFKNKRWLKYIRSLKQYDRIADHGFWTRPVKNVVAEFVESVLGKCLAFNPDWITVPQLPLVAGSSRNKINRALATATGDWRANTAFSGRLILPVLLTHQNLVNRKTARNPKVGQAQKCFVDARADGIWVVEIDLDDDSGASNMRNRIESLIQLHTELNAAISASIRVAGPYWGTNLVLWSQGLIDYPAIGVGGGFQYMTAGGRGTTPTPRVAIGPLRRIAGLSGLQTWLGKAMAKVTASHPVHKEFLALSKQLPHSLALRQARLHVARFYKKWFDTIATVPPQGRSLALFQDLSSAYALGKTLPQLDRTEKSRKPQAVAEPLMLNCL